jgi:hypothetical protein
MPRDAIAEWRRALIKREAAYALFLKTRALEPPPLVPSPGGILITPFDLRKTRRLEATGHVAAGDRGDLAKAIRVLQRHNRLLRGRFGMGWVDATNFVLGEAQRRGTSAALLARALSLRLRTEPAT